LTRACRGQIARENNRNEITDVFVVLSCGRPSFLCTNPTVGRSRPASHELGKSAIVGGLSAS